MLSSLEVSSGTRDAPGLWSPSLIPKPTLYAAPWILKFTTIMSTRTPEPTLHSKMTLSNNYQHYPASNKMQVRPKAYTH